MNLKKWLKENTYSLRGKNVALSGATGGIGRELCRYFASLGASVTMLDRNTERSLALTKELKEEFPELVTRHIRLDLEDIHCVRSVTESLLNDVPDYLILNAGAYHISRRTCGIGYNNVFQINFVSPYYMAKKLLPKIKERGGRIVAVGSIAHGYSEADPTDSDFSTRKKSSLVYGNAKRYLMYSLSALCDDAVAIAHPGITFTNITAHYPKLVFAIIKNPMKIIFMKPKKACLSIVKAVFSPPTENCWFGPSLFGIWGFPAEAKLKKIAESEAELIGSVAERAFNEMKNFKITL